jgi:hypothetical protein
MLAAIGEDPVENLENLPPSGNTALHVLQSKSRDFQEEGFWFNYEDDYVLTPDGAGNIVIPDNILSLDGTDADVIERRPFLYNRETKSIQFADAVSCSVILQLPWDELPSVARRYITALATETFVDGIPGAQAVTEARHRNLIRAKVAFERAVIRNEDLNLFNNNTIAQLTRRG